jgi:hypothetical protein
MHHHGTHEAVVGGLGENGASDDLDSDSLSSPLTFLLCSETGRLLN